MNLQFYPNVPVSSNNPSADQPEMTTNNQSINAWVGIDHIGFNANQGGWHTVIHEQAFTPTGSPVQWNPATPTTNTPPVTIPNSGMFFTMNYTNPITTVSDIQPFAKSGSGGVYILGGNNANYSNGWFWTGGMLFQYGFVPLTNALSQSGVVVFATTTSTPPSIPTTQNFRFPANILTIQTSLSFTSPANTNPPTNIPTSPGTISISSTFLNQSQFLWSFNTTGVSLYTGFYWLAIGQ